jgi:hypothetical protein
MSRRRLGWSIEQLCFALLISGLLYLLLLDGFIRLKTGHADLTVVRDVFPALLLFLGVAHVAAAPGKRPWRVPMAGFVVAWVACTIVQVYNPNTISVARGAQALKPHLEFVPFFFACAIAVTTRRRLSTLVLVIACAGAINGAVSLYQSQLSPAQLGAWGPGYQRLIVGDNPRAFKDDSGTERVRPPALGSEAGFGGILGVLALPCGIALALVERRGRRALAIATLPFLITAVVSSQTRAGVVAAVVSTVAFFLVLSLRKGGIRVIATVGLVGLLGVYAGNELITGRVTTDRYSTIAPSKLVNTYSEDRGGSLALIGIDMVKYPLGAGLGTGGPGSISGASANAGKISTENEITYVIAEAGVFGLMVMLLLLISTIRRTFKLARRPRDPSMVPIFCAVFGGLIGMVVLWFAGPVTAGPPVSSMFWIYAGLAGVWPQRLRRPASCQGETPAIISQDAVEDAPRHTAGVTPILPGAV